MIIRQKTENDELTSKFLAYLGTFPISSKTFKNYKSDISHFTAWIIFKIRSYGSFANSLKDALPFVKNELAYDYKDFLSENKESEKTINRRLSTLRHLARFFLESQVLDFDFMAGVANITSRKTLNLRKHPILNEFQRQLESENVSKNTIKNYMSDVRQFFSWLEAQKTFNTN